MVSVFVHLLLYIICMMNTLFQCGWVWERKTKLYVNSKPQTVSNHQVLFWKQKGQLIKTTNMMHILDFKIAHTYKCAFIALSSISHLLSLIIPFFSFKAWIFLWILPPLNQSSIPDDSPRLVLCLWHLCCFGVNILAVLFFFHCSFFFTTLSWHYGCFLVVGWSTETVLACWGEVLEVFAFLLAVMHVPSITLQSTANQLKLKSFISWNSPRSMFLTNFSARKFLPLCFAQNWWDMRCRWERHLNSPSAV